MNCNDMFYGSVTVGERGQIVIPAEARAELGINPGDKLLVMRHPLHQGLMVFQFEAVTSFVAGLTEGMEKIKNAEEA
ncbi:MAG TPA: AbrB/MazE/SpoVT family DNA-binding domain-containing protein [Fimbriimonadaceae bacterium]|nr:AbrB/MazE/SpoVT family DNA-binding domain-containing protein [Fimbriimonadaceae bacterium]